MMEKTFICMKKEVARVDGWWNEEETFYPFEETPEEDGFVPAEEPQNPFTPISVAERFDQFEQRPHPASKSFTPPKPGQLYGQAFSNKPLLTPAKPFSQIQQGDLYGYTDPSDQPIASADPFATPPVSYPPLSNPFGAGVGASPLGAATPDTLPTFTARTTPVRRSDPNQTQQNTPVPIWSIDDDPLPYPSATAGDTTSPYPGFPPLPQSNPGQQTGTASFLPLTQPPKQELDWSLPAYPEADPNWQPTGEEAPETPDFLLKAEPAKEETPAGEPDSPMEKLNIPAYLRVQPLPRKKPRPEPQEKPEEMPAETPEDTAAVEADDKPVEKPAAEVPAAEEKVYGNEIFMRPKTEPAREPVPISPPQEEQTDLSPVENPAEPAPVETPADVTTDEPADSAALESLAPATPVVLTPAPRRAHRSRMAQRTLSESTQEPENQPAEPKEPEEHPASVIEHQPSQAEKRRRRRSENALSEGLPAGENSDPFVFPVGAEEASAEPPADRPVQHESEPASDFFLPITDEEELAVLQPAAIMDAPSPAMDIDGEDDWQPYTSPQIPSFTESPDFSKAPAMPDNPFAAAYGDSSGIPAAEDEEWSLFDQNAQPVATDFSKAPAMPDNPFAAAYGDSSGIPAAEDEEWSLFDQNAQPVATDFSKAPAMPDNPFAAAYGDSSGIPAAEDEEWSLFDQNAQPVATDFSAPDVSRLLPMDDESAFQDGYSNLTSDESPLFGTSSYDAGAMPNPARGNLPYGVVSEFDTGSRTASQPQEPPTVPQAPDGSLLNGFTAGYTGPLFPPMQQEPAKPLLTKDRPATKPAKPAKPPINPFRLILLVLALAMAVFCIMAGSKMLLGYVQNTEEWSKAHQTFVGENGVSMDQAGETIQLPQDGSTFAPTGTPALAIAQPTVQPGHDAPPAATDAQQPTATPVRRTKIMQYPGNELRNILPDMAKIRQEYPEIIGKLVIPGVLEEWIMYRNNTYYLNHNYRGTSAEGGAVFMDSACTLETPPENLHLRASGSAPGKTFHALWQYKTGGMSFLYNAEVAHVTTLYEEVAYLLLAVIETSGDPTQFDYFNYTSYPTFATDEEMLEFVELAKQHSIYNLPTDIQPGDRLLTLSTVTGTGSEQSTNLVLIFRSMR